MDTQMNLVVGNTRKTNPLAIVSLILSIAGVSLLPWVGSVAAIVTGSIAQKEIRNQPELFDGEGLARAGVILGWIGTVLPLILIALALLFFIPLSFATM